ncbi:MAG: hypothetical protein ABEJ25_01460 [Candidatus Bipolaricaulia bacterium]
MKKPRISPQYKPGRGDKGETQSRHQKSGKKDSLETAFYLTGEKFQIALSELILYHQTQMSLKATKALTVAYRLEGMTNDLMAFFYWNGDCFALDAGLEEDVEATVRDWKPRYGKSLEFQHFSTHPNLHYLNKVRVASRELEKQYQAWNKSPEIVGQRRRLNRIKNLKANYPSWLAKLLLRSDNLTGEENLLNNRIREIDRYAGFLNRLSTFYWLAIQVERKELEVTPKYWNRNAT